jgi:hypothetical protein
VKAAAAEVKAGSPSDDPQPVYWASPSLSDPSSPFAGTDGARSADWRVRGLHALRISTRHDVRVLALREVRGILTVFAPPTYRTAL